MTSDSTNKRDPQWLNMLPIYLNLHNNNKIKNIEQVRQEYKETHEMLSLRIQMSPWGVKKLQYACLEQNKLFSPNIPEKEHWKKVLLTRLQCKLIMHDEEKFPPWVKLLPKDYISSLIEDIDNIISKFNSFENVIEYILKIDEKEGHFLCDVLGNKLNCMLED